MASMKYTKMWILLNEYNFQVDSQKYRDLLCCICKSLLKNAQQSICGCAFCFDCIKNYLATDAKYCPGRSNGCKELVCNIERNMQIDHAANKKVANVTVKCPIEFCDFKTELKYMDEHIESHIDDNSNHGKFLREPLEKLRKEISSLREDLQMYKKDAMSKELMIMKIRDEIDCLRKANEKELIELKEELVGSASFVRKSNAKELQEDDDIDWQLEIFTDETEADFSTSKKRRVQEPTRCIEAAGPRLTKEFRDLVAAEVKRNTESLRTTQNVLQEEIKLLRQELQNSERKRFVRSDLPQIDNKKGTAGEEEQKETENRSNGPSKSSSPPPTPQENAVVAAANSDGTKTTRRKLRRELPQMRIDLTRDVPEQSSAVSKPESTSKAACVLPSSAAPKPGNPRKPSKVSISAKPIHPVTLARRVDQKEKRIIKPFPVSRSRAFNPLATSTSTSKSAQVVRHSGNLTSLIEPLQWMRNISPFEFRIDNFSEKHLQSKQARFNSSVSSQPFYSAKNGYKMCLRIDFDPNQDGFSSHVGAFFCILRGECDDHLPWPMKLEITISIIDQITFLPYTSRTFDYASAPEHWKYVFHRPSMMNNYFWFGTPQFVHFDFIFNNAPLRLNDSILIRCSVGS